MTSPVVGVGCVVFKGEAVLLVRRAHPPRAGSWSLPGGKQQWGETLAEAALRELMEETAITADLLGIAEVVDLIDRDEAGLVRHHYTVVDYAARWLSGKAVAGDDAAEVIWALPDDFERLELTPLALQVIAKARYIHRMIVR